MNTADIIVLFVVVETPATVLDRVLQDNAETGGLWHIWLADPAVLPRQKIEIGCSRSYTYVGPGEGCGTVTPIDREWRSPFLGKTPEECSEWLTEWGGLNGDVETEGGGTAKVDTWHFLVLDETLKMDGGLSLCMTFGEDDVEDRQYELAEEWIDWEAAERGDPEMNLDKLSTEDQEEVEAWVETDMEIHLGVNCESIDVQHAVSFVMVAYSDQWRDFYRYGGFSARASKHWYEDVIAGRVPGEETVQPVIYEEESEDFLNDIDTTMFS